MLVFTPQGELAYVKRQSEEKDQRISELEESLTGTSLLVRTGIAQHLAYVCTVALQSLFPKSWLQVLNV